MTRAYTPPRSSTPLPGPAGLRLALPPHIPHYRTPLNPLSFLLRAALIVPDKPALVHPERGWQLTYAQWAYRALSLTHALRATNGWKSGDRVAVIAPNSPLIADAHYGVLGAQGVIVPINIRNNAREIAYVLEHSGSKVVLVDHEFAHLVPNPAPAGMTIIVSNDSGGQDSNDAYEAFLEQGCARGEALEREEKIRAGESARRGWELIMAVDDEEAGCSLCYTSGTTGRPKGVLTSYRGSYLAAVANAFEARITTDSVYLWVLPMFHACGWTFPWAVTAALGTHYILRKVDYSAIWDALLNAGITHYAGAPTVQIGVVNHPKAKRLPHVVRVAVAASAPTANLLSRLEALNLEPVHVYGLTETYGPFTRRYTDPTWASLDVDTRSRLMARQGHGFLVSDECRVVRRTEDTEQMAGSELVDVARDGKELGEIIIRGNMALKEYYNDPAATAKAIKQGWFHTGDLAVRMPGGEVHILDRGKDIIISGGENVSSLMVEQELASHPSVLECVLVARPHPKWGERGHAFIVLTDQARQEYPVNDEAKVRQLEEEIRKYAKSRMSGFAVPEWVQVVQELPKTSTGKLQKNVLRERVSKL